MECSFWLRTLLFTLGINRTRFSAYYQNMPNHLVPRHVAIITVAPRDLRNKSNFRLAAAPPDQKAYQPTVAKLRRPTSPHQHGNPFEQFLGDKGMNLHILVFEHQDDLSPLPNRDLSRLKLSGSNHNPNFLADGLC